MATQATGRFRISSWDEDTYAELSAPIGSEAAVALEHDFE